MKYFGITDPGLVRKHNQDSYVIATNEVNDVFALVCDGIGGNLGGDIASRMAVAFLSKAFSDNRGFKTEEDAIGWINRVITACNSQIFEYGQSHATLKGMGTTLSGAMITKIGTFIINIGDSRTYAYYNDGRLVQVTNDHTLVNDMLMHGELTKEEAENFPRKNVITNALGVWENVRSDIDVHHEDIGGFLICSDGLHGYVPYGDIKEVVMDQTIDARRRCRRLMKLALKAGGLDNITIVLVDNENGGGL